MAADSGTSRPPRRRLLKGRAAIPLALTAGLAVGIGATLLMLRGHRAPTQEPAAATGAAPGVSAPAPQQGRRVAYYRSPMNPRETSPVPRKDEMGMDYVPVYEDEVSGSAPSPPGLAAVTIDTQRQQLIGLKTAAVTWGERSWACLAMNSRLASGCFQAYDRLSRMARDTAAAVSTPRVLLTAIAPKGRGKP